MSSNPSPFVMTMVVKQRHADFRAEASRGRSLKLADGSGSVRRSSRWSGLRAAVVVAAALAVYATGTLAAQGSSPQPLAALAEAADAVARYVTADEPETIAVQKVREARGDAGETASTADAEPARAAPKLMLGKISLSDILVS